MPDFSAAATRTDETGMRLARRTDCDDRPELLVLAKYSVFRP